MDERRVTKISYDSTKPLKYFYIVISYAALVLGALSLLAIGSLIYRLICLVCLGLLTAWAHRFVKKLSAVADDVFDLGESLLVRKGAEEETIPLRSIKEVGVLDSVSPALIRLRLASPGRFGSEVSFFQRNAFSSSRPLGEANLGEKIAGRIGLTARYIDYSKPVWGWLLAAITVFGLLLKPTSYLLDRWHLAEDGSRWLLLLGAGAGAAVCVGFPIGLGAAFVLRRYSSYFT